MKLKPEHLKKLAKLIYSKLAEQKLITINTSEAIVLSKIEKILLSDAETEMAIEAEAKKTMEKFKAQVASGEVEYHKMFQMVKKQLMKDKGFIA